MVTALAPLLLNERLGWTRVAAVGVGFAGTLVVIRPGWTADYLAVSLVFFGAAASAIVQILSRKLADHDRPLTSNTYMVLIGFMLTSLTLPFAWRTPDALADIFTFVLIGLLGGLGHYFLVSAFELAPAAVVAPLNYAQMIGAVLLGYVVFGEVPDLWTWTGSAVIAFSGALVLLPEKRDRA
jgi:drug/metabolite transporter (DMT)-like permease